MEENERQKYLQIVTRKLVIFTGALIFILFVFSYAVHYSRTERTFLSTYIFMSGFIGGFVSIQQRLPKIKVNELRQLSQSWLSILLIPVNGGIFAIVLTLMFLTGIFEGSLFPNFLQAECNEECSAVNFTIWLFEISPKEGADFAKLLFWSFVAGFSERFVPQIIQKTTDQVDNN